MKFSSTFWYYIFLLTGAAFLLSANFVFGFEMRTIFIIGVAYVLVAHAFQSRIIVQRQFNYVSKLNYAASWPDYMIFTVVILAIAFGLLGDSKSSTYNFLLPLSFMGILTQTAFRMWMRAPRYVLTADQLQENDFYLKERKLEELFGIRFDWSSLVVRVQFVNEYDIKIFRPRYSKAELANFIQHIINQAPVEADIEPEVQEFLKKYGTPSHEQIS